MAEVTIKVNGKEYKALTEKTLLDNLISNGIKIPHLCHNKSLESYGGCGLCVVEVEGVNKPLRACSTSVKEGMSVITDSAALQNSRKVTLAFLCSDHSGDCKAPCFYSCPTHQDIQGYVGLIANGMEKEALRLIKEDNPLPASIGRVCPHPCEKDCRRALVDEPVSICALKRFAADSLPGYIPTCEPKNGKRVAVVGGGPAGLSCAYFLLMRGYDVEIFEAEKKCGGMLRYGIPEYRLPKAVLDSEIECIEKMGAVIHCEKRLGRDFTLDELKNGFDAVFLGIGAWKSGSLRCENDGAEGVLGGIDMLYAVQTGELTSLKGKVAVVGGGNTAIDAVRTAVRLGARDVTLIYRRTESEMPAEKLEIKEAKEEGVVFRFLEAPLKVLTENGKATGLLLQKMRQGEPDKSGRRAPVPVEGATEEVYFDTIISAVGQSVITEGLSSVSVTGRNTVRVDANTYMTSVEGVFAAGDAVNSGPDIAIRAIAGGKYAASAVDAYLKGEDVKPELPEYSKNTAFDKSLLSDEKKLPRVEYSVKAPEVRKKDFSESALTFTEEEALREAARCLECGCKAVYDCKLLPLMREYESFSAADFGKKHKIKRDAGHPFIIRDSSKCVLCGLCVRTCREIENNEALGLFGRGFETLPETPFSLPLDESVCSSCGLCAAVCPTGAISFKLPGVKTPPLKYNEERFVCTRCDEKCEFIKKSAEGTATKLVPLDLRKSCSLGVLGELYDEAKKYGAAPEILEKAALAINKRL